MIALAVVVPRPPLLVPRFASGATAQSAPLREACLAAVSRLGVAAPLVVSADPFGRRSFPPRTRGSFRGFGADVVVGLDPTAAGEADPELLLPLLLAGWLRDCVAPAALLTGELVAPLATAAQCRALGAELAGGTEPAGLLVGGAGATTHTVAAPRHLDGRVWSGRLPYSAAPHGVVHHVAVWTPGR